MRSIIEPEIIRLAVLNMSTRDILEMKKILAKLESIKTNASDFALWDERSISNCPRAPTTRC